MKNNHNEILEEYQNLLAKGFSRFAEKEKKQKPLYNVSHESKKYENNIMEQAHPNQCILTKSYDPVNSLIENDIERQNITLNILSKKPTGQSINKKYAQHQLLLSLIKTANYLESINNMHLINKTDKCINMLHKSAGFNFDAIGTTTKMLFIKKNIDKLNLLQDNLDDPKLKESLAQFIALLNHIQTPHSRRRIG